MRQITNNIMMIRPANFGYNEETAKNNAFQSTEGKDKVDEIRDKAIQEFDSMVETLRSKGVNVVVVQDTSAPIKPDAIFPNNWISFHEDGALITYPMYAENRRIERREDIIESIGKEFDVKRRYSFENYEDDNLFLEGTGSMIFDRPNKIVYACLSQRTDIQILDKWCVLTGFTKVAFDSTDRNDNPIYHTNVMMALGEDFCVLVEESIKKPNELAEVRKSLTDTGKTIVPISIQQMEQFAGNMLQVCNSTGDKYLVMSKCAYNSLNEKQLKTLGELTNILPIDIETIEYFGGGSVRCMMAEIFLPKI